MTKEHNARNERIKRRYLEFLKHAKRQSEQSIDKAAAAIERFDAWNRRKDFRQFHVEQAMASCSWTTDPSYGPGGLGRLAGRAGM